MADRAADATVLLHAYRGMVRAAVARTLAYRAQLTIWVLTSLFPLIMMTVWLSVVDQVGPAAGWDRSDFVSYYVAAAALFHVTTSHLTWAWDEDVRTGDLSFRLLKPVSPVHHHVAMEIGFRSVTVAALLPLVVAAALLLDDVRYPVGPGTAVLVLVAVVAAFALSSVMSLAFAMGSFWTTQSANLYALWWGAGAFLSGWIAPVSVLPGPVRAAAEVLPFRSALGFPLELLLGRLDAGEVVAGFTVTAVWLGVFLAVQQVLWRRGLVRYQAVGG